MRKLAVLLGLLGLTFGAVQVTAQEEPVATHHVVEAGESWFSIARQYNVTASELARQNFLTVDEQLHPNHVLHVVPGQPPTTTTTTTVPETTTTVPPTTTSVPPTTTTEPTTTTTVPVNDDFVESFVNASSVERFQLEEHHRSDHLDAEKSPWRWPGDHDMNCGGPTTTRTVQAKHLNDSTESVWWCAPNGPDTGHLMFGVGDVSGYSIVSVAPDQVFDRSNTSRVCFDMNSTDLGGRQWVELLLLTEAQYQANGGRLAYVTPDFGQIDGSAFIFNSQAVDVMLSRDRTWIWVNGSDAQGNGPFDDNISLTDKATRVQRCLTDNRDGTMTYTEAPMPGRSFDPITVNGRFPDRFRVVVGAHGYTPLKDGPVVGHTWHIDNFSVT